MNDSLKISTEYFQIFITLLIIGYNQNPYNGVVCNDIILATGVFSSRELWKLSKCKNQYTYFSSTHCTSFVFISSFSLKCNIASILEDSGDGNAPVTPLIKMEAAGGMCSGSASVAAYYCNSYPITTASGSSAMPDRTTAMVPCNSYSTTRTNIYL